MTVIKVSACSNECFIYNCFWLLNHYGQHEPWNTLRGKETYESLLFEYSKWVEGFYRILISGNKILVTTFSRSGPHILKFILRFTKMIHNHSDEREICF